MFHSFTIDLANPAHARMQVLQFRRVPSSGLKPWRKGTLQAQHPSRMVTRRMQTSRLRRWEKNHTSEIHIGDFTLDFSIQLMLEHLSQFSGGLQGPLHQVHGECSAKGLQASWDSE